MTDKVRTELRVELARRGWKVPKLADAADIRADHVRALLGGKRGRLSWAWSCVLDALGLELTVVPKAHETPSPRANSSRPHDLRIEFGRARG